jgi:hypothetical protein
VNYNGLQCFTKICVTVGQALLSTSAVADVTVLNPYAPSVSGILSLVAAITLHVNRASLASQVRLQ